MRITPGLTCKRCLKKLRPFRALATEYPGTVSCKARGLCSRCYNLDKDYKPKEAGNDRTEATRASLQAYLDRRRPYRQEAGTL